MQRNQVSSGTTREIHFRAIQFIAVAAFSVAACTAGAEQQKLRDIETRSEQFLSLLRAQQWDGAAKMVLLNDAAYHRFNMSKQRDAAALRKATAKLFEQVYSNVKPGAVVFVRINSGDSTLASVAYRHGDLDGFNMRLFDGEWYYSFE